MKPHGKPPAKFSAEAHNGNRGPSVPYWQNPIYQFVARSHKIAETARNAAEMQRLSSLMQLLAENKMSAEQQAELEALRAEHEKREKSQRKKQARSDPRAFAKEETIARSEVNVTEIKRKLFNLQTSPENMIRTMEMLPNAQKREVAASLTPYLRSKIATYLKQHNM